jgi:hypothetical protein
MPRSHGDSTIEVSSATRAAPTSGARAGRAAGRRALPETSEVSMAVGRLSTTVACPPEDAFAVLADLTRDPDWRREWVASRADADRPPRVGDRTTLFGRALGRPMQVVYEVTSVEPGRSVAWASRAGPMPLSFSRSVEPVEDGTRITFVYWSEEPGLVRLLWPLVGWIGRRQLVGDLPALRRVLGVLGAED